MKEYIRAVANFAQLVQTCDDIFVLEIKIQSFALRRRLSQELQSFYRDSNLIFTQFSKASPIFTVRRWRPKPEDGQVMPQVQETKLTLEQLRDSPFDKIIKGEEHASQVLFEDERVIAFPSKRPCAMTHFIVLAKTLERHSLIDVSEENESDRAMLGHMMVVAAQVAKSLNLQEGYRIISNNGKHSY